MSKRNAGRLLDTNKQIEYIELQQDWKLMRKLVAGRNLNKEEDIDKIYGLLLKYKGGMFCSPLGEKFVNAIQHRTSAYKRVERECKQLNLIAGIFFGIAMVTLFFIVCLYVGVI